MDEDDSPERAAYKAFIEDLQAAEFHAQKALDALYSLSGPKRGFWYRIGLGRAQNTLMGLLRMELNRKGDT